MLAEPLQECAVVTCDLYHEHRVATVAPGHMLVESMAVITRCPGGPRDPNVVSKQVLGGDAFRQLHCRTQPASAEDKRYRRQLLFAAHAQAVRRWLGAKIQKYVEILAVT